MNRGFRYEVCDNIYKLRATFQSQSSSSQIPLAVMESSLYSRRLSAPSLYDHPTPFLAIPKPRVPVPNAPQSYSSSLPNYFASSSPPMSPTSSRSQDPDSPRDTKYSFVAIPGHQVKKRPRRRYDEIERLYKCNHLDCSKAYGTLNHLNAHVVMQGHGGRRSPGGSSYFLLLSSSSASVTNYSSHNRI